MISGIFLVDKESGESSARVISRLKKKLNLEKLGHAGTLDPMATGLLVCLSGAATRLAHFAEKGNKIYSGVFRFGVSTSTDDITGEVLHSHDSVPTIDQIKHVLPEFTGVIAQTPPQISAVKVDGERAYKVARRGEEVTLKSREVVIDKFEISTVPGSASDFRFTIACSKGTYIRSLARDIGARLGGGGCLAELRREGSFPFSVHEAKRLNDIEAADMKHWETLFPRAIRFELDAGDCKRLQSGDIRILRELSGRDTELSADSTLALYSERGSAGPSGLLLRAGNQWTIGANVFS